MDIITPDGWLQTGDVGMVDEEGYIYVVDRKKELIKYNGFQGQRNVHTVCFMRNFSAPFSGTDGT